VQVDNDGQVTLAHGGRDLGDFKGIILVDSAWGRLGDQKINSGTTSFDIADPGNDVLGLARAERSFLHEPAQLCPTAGQSINLEFVMHFAVARASHVFAKHTHERVTEHFVFYASGSGPVRSVMRATCQI
jgi:hypothetical protein